MFQNGSSWSKIVKNDQTYLKWSNMSQNRPKQFKMDLKKKRLKWS